MQNMDKKKWMILGGVVAMLLIALFVILGQSSTAKEETDTANAVAALSWQEQYDLGIRYLEAGNYEEAIIAFTAAITLDPQQIDPYIGRGDAYIACGETESNLLQALADYKAALALDNTLANTYAKLADVYVRQGDYENALAILQEGYEITGDTMLGEWLASMQQGIYTDANGVERCTKYYDSEGNLTRYYIISFPEPYQTKEQEFDGDGVLQYTLITTEDASGRTIGMTTIDGDGNIGMDIQTDGVTAYIGGHGGGGIYDTTSTAGVGYINVRYLENGQHVKEVIYTEEGILQYTTIAYNDKGQLYLYKDYDTNDILLEYTMYEYDESGRCIKTSLYTADDVLDWYVLEEYDENGRTISYMCYTGEDVFRYGQETEYDENGNSIKVIIYGENKVITSMTEKLYDESGTWLGTTYYNGDGTISKYTRLELNEDGVQVVNTYDGDGTLTSFSISE